MPVLLTFFLRLLYVLCFLPLHFPDIIFDPPFFSLHFPPSFFSVFSFSFCYSFFFSISSLLETHFHYYTQKISMAKISTHFFPT